MAGASLTGDFKRLAQLVAGLEKLGGQGWKAQTNRLLAEEALSQVQKSFATGKDPEGNPWKPLKRRRGQPLRDTGRLLNSMRVRSTSASFTVQTPVIYAATHQYGRGPVPARPWLPTDTLPPSWRKAFIAVLEEQRDAALGR